MTSSSRAAILAQVRRQLPQATELPRPLPEPITYADPVAQFSAVLQGVGGRCVVVDTLAEIDRALAAQETYASAAKRYSGVPHCGETNFPLPPAGEPHRLDDVDFALLPGELAVAENAAVWVATDDILARTLYFLAQHIALVVPAAAIVSNMHEAYQRIEVTRHRFGTFLSGPSKTADIEQSLVIGAHGARSQTVFLCRQLPAQGAGSGRSG